MSEHEGLLPLEGTQLTRRQFLAGALGLAAGIALKDWMDTSFSVPVEEISGWLNPGSHWQNLSTGDDVVFGVGPDSGVLKDWQRWEQLEKLYVAEGENGQYFGYRVINSRGDFDIIRDTGYTSTPFALPDRSSPLPEEYNMVATSRANPDARVIMPAKFGHEGADNLTISQRKGLAGGDFSAIGRAYATGWERAGVEADIIVGDSLGARNALAVVNSGIMAVRAAALIDPPGATYWDNLLRFKKAIDQEAPYGQQLLQQSPDRDQARLVTEMSKFFNSRMVGYLRDGRGADMFFRYPHGMRKAGLEAELEKAVTESSNTRLDWYVPGASTLTHQEDAVAVTKRLEAQQAAMGRSNLEVLLGEKATHLVFQGHEYLIAQGVIPRLLQRAGQ